jgi:hypothetical protein
MHPKDGSALQGVAWADRDPAAETWRLVEGEGGRRRRREKEKEGEGEGGRWRRREMEKEEEGGRRKKVEIRSH